MKGRQYYIIVAISIILGACNGSDKKVKNPTSSEKDIPAVKVPDFDSDSAYRYVDEQVAFGPRVPNTEAHKKTAKYLTNKLKAFTDSVIVQSFQTRAFDGTVLNGKNIIGITQPEKKSRILLCAHWDSRPFADYDPDPENHDIPIAGANDGASGVGVLLEIARQLQSQNPRIGVDIIFFDAEDYGPPQDEQRAEDEHNWWALGSQYWANNPHDYNYKARYAVLLDMVGAEGAKFYYEGYSFYYGAKVLKKIWKTGHRIGYQDRFIFEQKGYINDDHIPINQITDITAIDIIHLDENSSNSSFFEHWHTVNDNMDAISKESLKVVGQTLLTVIYEEK